MIFLPYFQEKRPHDVGVVTLPFGLYARVLALSGGTPADTLSGDDQKLVTLSLADAEAWIDRAKELGVEVALASPVSRVGESVMLPTLSGGLCGQVAMLLAPNDDERGPGYIVQLVPPAINAQGATVEMVMVPMDDYLSHAVHLTPGANIHLACGRPVADEVPSFLADIAHSIVTRAVSASAALENTVRRDAEDGPASP